MLEALSARRRLDRILLGPASGNRGLMEIERLARAADIPVVHTTRESLERLSQTGHHQGVIASCAPLRYFDLTDVVCRPPTGSSPILVLLDGVQDPQNLGAILRVADGAGVGAVILPGRRSAGLGPGAVRASAGAAEHVPVVRVSNLVRSIRVLQDAGYWVVGAEGDGSATLYETDLTGPIAVVIGGESTGLSRLARARCDVVVRIPLAGRLNSLNVATAAAVFLFEIVRQRQVEQT